MQGYHCEACGQHHAELPLAFDANAPYVVSDIPEEERDDRLTLGSDQCILDGMRYFIRGQLELPITGRGDVFTWGVWVEVSERDFDHISDLWEVEGRESTPPFPCTVATHLPLYSDPTLDLPARLHTRPVGLRPFVELRDGKHLLQHEQERGITLERVRAIATNVMHGSS